jgi:hypothetical protein
MQDTPKPDRESVLKEAEKALNAINDAGYHAAIVVVDNEKKAACLVGMSEMEGTRVEYISKCFEILIRMGETINDKIPDVMDEVFLEACDGDKEKAAEAQRIFKECIAENLTEMAISKVEQTENQTNN